MKIQEFDWNGVASMPINSDAALALAQCNVRKKLKTPLLITPLGCRTSCRHRKSLTFKKRSTRRDSDMSGTAGPGASPEPTITVCPASAAPSPTTTPTP